MSEPLTNERVVEIFGKSEGPKCAQLLGFKVVRVDMDAGRVEAEFLATDNFTNPMGAIQGGFLTAMLDEVMSVAGVVKSRLDAFVPSLEIKTSYLSEARPGPIYGVGRVVRLGRSVAFMEGELTNPAGKIVAKASATGMLRQKSR
jgi:uncharacterized protein (TIGR00369 family)